MNRMVFILGVVIMGISAHLSFQLFNQGQAIQKQAGILENTNFAYEARFKYLSSLKDGPVRSIVDSYQDFYEHLKVYAAFYDWKIFISINGLGREGSIEAAVKPSIWEGIIQLDLKMDFHELLGTDEYINIFQMLMQLQNLYLFDVVSIHQSGKDLQIMARVYGVPSNGR